MLQRLFFYSNLILFFQELKKYLKIGYGLLNKIFFLKDQSV